MNRIIVSVVSVVVVRIGLMMFVFWCVFDVSSIIRNIVSVRFSGCSVILNSMIVL